MAASVAVHEEHAGGAAHVHHRTAEVVAATSDAITGSADTLRFGQWSAWVLLPLWVVYFAGVVASGAATGAAQDPSWAVAEVVTIVGATIQVALFAAIHESAPLSAKLYSRLALGWMLVMATLTTTVHFVELTVTRRIDLAAAPTLASVFWRSGMATPNLLMGVEFAAWHLFFGLAMVFGASSFKGTGLERAVRVGLRTGGVLCLVGLLGPALGDPNLRLIGVLGYGIIFPVMCLLIGFVFRTARHAAVRASGASLS